MKKSLILLSLAAAAALTPAAISFANTQAPVATAALETPAVHAARTQAQPMTAQAACKPAVRVAYAGYGEAGRSCSTSTEESVLQMRPGKPGQR